MRLTIKAKLAATFAIVVAMSAGGMFLAIQNMGSLNDEIEKIVNGNAERIQITAGINASTLRIARDERNLIIANSPSEFASFADSITAEKAAVEEQLGQLLSITATEVGKQRAETFRSAWAGFLAEHGKVTQLAMLNSDVKAREAIEAARQP